MILLVADDVVVIIADVALPRGIEAGRAAYRAGRMPKKLYSAIPSSPTSGLIGK